MKCLAGMLAALWVAAAQSQTPASDQPPTAEQTPTAVQTAAPTMAQQAAGASASTSSGAGPEGAQRAAPAAATPDNAAPTTAQRAPAAPTEVSAAQTPEANSVAQRPAAADVAQAVSYLKSAAADFTNCRRPSACYVYFDTFGVAIPFADGSIVPFSHVQRLTATSRECIKKAKALEAEGNRSLAVQWAMAARIENRSIRDWLGNHPDAVLEALRQVTVL